MDEKRSFNVYYLLISEGATEFIIFAYLTKNKFRELFEKSNIKFSNKVEIIKDGKQIVSQGKLGGAGNIGDFKKKHSLIKAKYSGQKLFFVLDKDLDDSLSIEKIIKSDGDIIQFIEFNSEYLLLKFAGRNPKKPSEFNTLGDFRNYSKIEFKKYFNKVVSDMKDVDLNLIFNSVSDEEIKKAFEELFSTLS